MKNKLTILIIIISMNCFSQENKQSEIIISRDNLISLLQKFRKQKTNLMASNSETPTLDYKAKAVEVLTDKNYVQTNDKSIQKKIDSLTLEIAILNKKVDLFLNSAVRKDTIYQSRMVRNSNEKMIDTVYKTTSSVDTLYMNQQAVSSRTASTTDDKIEALNKKYDLMLENQKRLLQKNQPESSVSTQDLVDEKSNEKVTKTIGSKKDVANVEKLQPKAMQKPAVTTLQTTIPVATSSPKIIRDTIYIKENNFDKTIDNSASEYSKLAAIYSKVKKQVFFNNNSTSIKQIDFVALIEVMKIIEQNPTVDIYLEGFASKKGSSIYNEKLSLQRTEAVKQYMISKGIHPKRILSNYLGVDYAAPNEDFARRVDITFEVRK